MKENYATTQTNTWDVSVNGDGSVTATLDNNGLLTISGTGKMKDWRYITEEGMHAYENRIKVRKIII